MLLKSLMASSTELLKFLWVSTQLIARTAPNWLSFMMKQISRGHASEITLTEM
jgi:hypothetical protein